MASEIVGGQPEGESSPLWFAKDGAELLYFKVNRRPVKGNPDLFAPEEDKLAHIERVLSYYASAVSGRNPKREWRLGNLHFDHEHGYFTGLLGWYRTGEAVRPEWDGSTGQWVDHIVEQEEGAVSPVAFTLDMSTLGILKHPTFTTEKNVLDAVLSEIFNKGEIGTDFPRVVWGVEPLGDEDDFYGWLGSVDQLTYLSMTFKRPNPDGEAEFDFLFERLDELRAEVINERIVARDREEGLDKTALRKDRTTRGFISAAMSAFGTVMARGFKDGIRVRYDQRDEVLRERLTDVGTDMDTATEAVLDAVARKGAERRQTKKLKQTDQPKRKRRKK